MTSAERIERLKQAAGQAGDLEMVASCDAALSGDTHAVMLCLDICREHEVNAMELDTWTRSVASGDYLARYWEGEDDPGSRCGFSDSELATIDRKLGARGLRIEADDVGLRVVDRKDGAT